MVVKVAVPQRFKLRVIPDIRNLIFGSGQEIHYIGGTEVLPPPLEGNRETEMIQRLGTEYDEEAKKTLIAVYGDALGQPVPLQIELEEFEERLERLRKAYEEGKETEPKDTQERVKNAIMAHENRIALLKKRIGQE